MAFIYFTVGQKGSGKSAFESRRALAIINGYTKTEKKYPELKRRIFFSNQKFAKRIEEAELYWKTEYNSELQQWDYLLDEKDNRIVNNPDGHLFYWQDAYDWMICPRPNCWRGSKEHPLHHADVLVDEMADHASQHDWPNIPKAIKQCWSHARKRSVRWFCDTQKYEMVAIDFRRQIDSHATWLMKILGTRDIDATLPDVKHPFVLQMETRFDILDIENETDTRGLWELRQGLPWFHLYTKKDFSVFDTTFELPPTKYNLYREEFPRCINHPHCADPEGNWHNVKHVKL